VSTPVAEDQQPKFGKWMGSMWLYTVLRFALFFAVWGVIYLIGLHGYVGAVLALVVSVPLSFVLLAKPRAMFTEQLQLRMDARNAARARLDKELDPGNDE
jgi:hypothetical protein